ncbi:MAG TPA: class I SAM-dependent methyltransferase [Polyangia bacterium]|jgi:trans-aconitate methyltransferase
MANDWNEHWSRYASAAEQNPAQAYRRDLVFRQLALDAAVGAPRIVELGSGQGDLSRQIKTRWPRAELLGLDLSETGLEIARQKVPDGVFFQADFMRPLAVPSQYLGWATHAVCSEVLEHVEDPVRVLENVRPCLAPGARLVVTVPAGPMSAFDRHIGHRRHFTRDTLADTLKRAGFQIASLEGAGFPFFNLYRLLVIARGRGLVDAAIAGQIPRAASAAMRVFSWLFRWNSASTTRGWQLLATAIAPA